MKKKNKNKKTSPEKENDRSRKIHEKKNAVIRSVLLLLFLLAGFNCNNNQEETERLGAFFLNTEPLHERNGNENRTNQICLKVKIQ